MSQWLKTVCENRKRNSRSLHGKPHDDYIPFAPGDLSPADPRSEFFPQLV